MHNDIRNHFQEQNTNHFTQFYNDKVKQILFTLKKKKEKKRTLKNPNDTEKSNLPDKIFQIKNTKS